MNEIDALLHALWDDYAALNPQAARIHALLAERGQAPVNDHIAFRAYAGTAMDLAAVAA